MSNSIALKGKKILLAEDESSFAASLKSVLEGAGMDVVVAPDGETAMRLVDSGGYTIVLSDIRMPKITGIDLLQHIQKSQPTLPVVLMTGFSELADAQKAAELGAKGFLNKPFRLKDLTEQLEKILNHTDEEWAKKEENFSALRIEEFLAGHEIKHEIFVKVQSRGYVRIAAEGATLSKPQVKVLRERGLKLLYIQKKDLLQFVGLNWEVRSEKASPAIMDRARKQLDSIETLAPYPIEGLESACEMTYAMLELLALDPAALKTLERMEALEQDLLNRALRVSVFAILIARAAGLKSPRVSSRIALAAILHDAGLTELPKELALIDPHSTLSLQALEAEQRKTYELHTRHSAALAGRVTQFPLECIQAIEQHHEECGGKGYPGRLLRPKLSSMGRILFFSGEFCQIAFPKGKPANIGEAVKRVLRWRDERADPFDADYVKAFATLLTKGDPENKAAAV